MQCVSERRFVLKMERHRPPQRKRPLFPLSFEGKVEEDEKIQALKQKYALLSALLDTLEVNNRQHGDLGQV